MFLLRAGFARCAYCKQAMMARRIATRNEQWFGYSCPNRDGKCTRFAVPADKLDAAERNTVAELADHTALLEQAIELAMKNRSLDDEFRAIRASLADWKAKVRNYEESCGGSEFRGRT